MGLTFDTRQVDAALRKLAAMDTTPVVQAGADILADHWRERAPVASGALRDGIYGETRSPTEAEAGATAVYAIDTEFRSSKPGWASGGTADAVEPATEAMRVAAAQLLVDVAKKAGK